MSSGLFATKSVDYIIADYKTIWRINPRALFALRRIQLSLHDIQLSPENASGHYTNHNQETGEPANIAGPSRHHSFINLMLAVLFFAPTAALFASFKSTEYADDQGLTCTR